MSSNNIKRNTANYNLSIPKFDRGNWQALYESNMDILDAAIFAATGLTNIKGLWSNGTAYTAPDRYVDDTDQSVWECRVSHTSAASSTFAADRIANPTYWEAITTAFYNGGAFAATTAYNANTFIIGGTKIGLITAAYTSGASYDDDVTAGDIITIVDFQVAQDWATKAEDSEVTTGLYSALHWAAKAAASATLAASFVPSNYYTEAEVDALIASAGSSVDLTSSGAITTGNVAVLNADGTASTVTNTVQARVEGAVSSTIDNGARSLQAVYDESANAVVLVYIDINNSYRPTAIAGTVSGQTITWGSVTELTTTSAKNSTDHVIDVCYNPDEEVICVAYTSTSGTTRFVGASITGTTISAGTDVEVNSYTGASYVGIVYHPLEDMVVIAFKGGASNTYAIAATMVSTVPTFGTAVAGYSTVINIQVEVDTENGDIIVIAGNGSNQLYCMAYTYVGTTLTYTSQTVGASLVYHTYTKIYFLTDRKYLLVSRDYSGNKVQAVIMTKDGAGNTDMAVSSVVTVIADVDEAGFSYDAARQILYITVTQNTSNTGDVYEYFVSDDTISFLTIREYDTTYGTTAYIHAGVYDPDTDQQILAFIDSSTNLKAFVHKQASNETDADNFIGISKVTVADAELTSVATHGALVDNQTGLVIGSLYFVQDDGSIATTPTNRPIGKAITATDLLLGDYTKSNRIVEEFTTSGIFTKEADDVGYYIELIDGGGGGGWANGGYASGGSGGGCLSLYVDASFIGATEDVVVGAGGAKSTALTVAASSGGLSSFGLMTNYTAGSGGVHHGSTAASVLKAGGAVQNNNADYAYGTATSSNGHRLFSGGCSMSATSESALRIRQRASIMGGGAGGGVYNSSAFVGGKSQNAGNGGDASASGAAQDGIAPGGGGGAGSAAGNPPGDGARGVVRITRYKGDRV